MGTKKMREYQDATDRLCIDLSDRDEDVEAYLERAAERVCMLPPCWSAGDRIRLIIAPDAEPAMSLHIPVI